MFACPAVFYRAGYFCVRRGRDPFNNANENVIVAWIRGKVTSAICVSMIAMLEEKYALFDKY